MELFLRLLASRGLDLDRGRERAVRWAEATHAIGDLEVDLFARAWKLAGALEAGRPSLHHLAEHAVAHRRALDGERASYELGRLELCLEALEHLEDDAIADRISQDTLTLRAVLETFRDDPSTSLVRRLRRLFPEPRALARPVPRHQTVEHEASPDPSHALPLLDHLADRCLGRKLAGLESNRLVEFQKDTALGKGAFAVTAGVLDRVRTAGLLPPIRIAMAFLDFAKGGTEEQRDQWRAAGADLSIHNLAARRIIEASGGLGRFPALLRAPVLEALALALIETHGLAGQAVRGETPLALFAPFVAFLRDKSAALGEHIRTDPETARRLAVDCLHLIDVCDTAAVREGLLDDSLHRELVAVEEEVLAAAGARTIDPIAALVERETSRWRERLPGGSPETVARARLIDRLARLRGRRDAHLEAVAEVIDPLPREVVLRLADLLRMCQLWYVGAATDGLSSRTQLVLLALGLTAAEGSPAIDTGAPFHLSLQPLLGRLGATGERSVVYRRRLLETALAPVGVEEVLEGRASSLLAGTGGERPVMMLVTEIGRASAIAIDSEESEEARALLTLLPIYERKSNAAFHGTLKTLCDLYGLRKDEFDRVANEAMYLETMNSARSDKARMLDFVRPGRIVEIGPGGGVVLDLLAERFPTSEIIGVDASRMVVEALSARRTKEQRRWSIEEADAYRLGEMFEEGTLDTVVLCSLLHEIYSYVERDGRRFRLESVRDLLRVAFRALGPGGRIVIRDGVMPPPAERILRFLAPDARPFFDLFVEQFDGRPITFEPIDADRVRLSAADAMEFLYTYTWGPESFPYEVREQYGVLAYDGYVEAIAGWLGADARILPLPAGYQSYLQPGYRAGLAGKIELFDTRGLAVELPDSNCLIVVERLASGRT